MRRASGRASDGSVISVDPAVARQITGASTMRGSRKISRPGSSAKNVTADTETGKRDENKKPSSKPATRKNSTTIQRNNSLKRVKNSTEILRQRSQRVQPEPQNPDPNANSRTGRSFTVSNVGTGGMMYLRPAHKQQSSAPAATPFVFGLLTPPKSAFLPPGNDNDEGGNASDIRESFWSDSQSSENIFAPLSRSATNAAKRPKRNTDGRSYSFSMVDDHHKTSSESKPGTLKIVIDRSEPQRPATAHYFQNFALPSLSVPIPHYKLGKPRFSAQGTPVLRSSAAYTRTSATPSENVDNESDLDEDNFVFPAPPKPQAKGRPLGRNVNMITPSGPVRTLREANKATESGFPSEILSEPREPIRPGIFDDLAQHLEDPDVIQYSIGSGEISAATPARIVAQISSESFMDYELVSDFFLTFRSYMSTSYLLDLLLARLRWAIGRLEGDGRVVRIRTFAALRHWILNYFMDDFVTNRSLRVNFCQQINEMYTEVSARPSGGGSDLKILQDLKRCWNGRCSLYWDSPQFSVDVPSNIDIVPGGIYSDRNSDVKDTFHFSYSAEDIRPVTAATKQSIGGQSWFGEPPKQERQYHQRQVSTVSAVGGASMKSDDSLQPTSCSLPSLIGKRSSSSMERSKGPQLASVQSRRRKAPANLELPTSNQQSIRQNTGSTLGTRDGRPASQPQDLTQFITFEHSLIRGQLLPPASALIEVLPPTSAPPDMSTFDLDSSDSSIREERGSRSSGQASPAVKNIFGSIRRALSSRQGPNTTLAISAPSQLHVPSLHGKTSALPLTVAKSNDNLRIKTATQNVRGKLRIDLLCAAVVQSYEKAVSAAAANPAGDRLLGDHPGGEFLRPHRLPSNVTAQSGSILIVDDTGLKMPAMSGGLPLSDSQQGMHQHRFTQYRHSTPDDDTSQGIYLQPSTYDARERTSTAFDGRALSHRSTPLTAERLANNDSRTSMPLKGHSQEILPPARTSSLQHRQLAASSASSTTLRRHGSILSSNGHGKDPSINATNTTLSSSEDSVDSEDPKLPAQPLRRRPGGDLKKNQNVHDLETNIHHDSFDSDMTGSSMVIMSNKSTANQGQSSTGVGSKPISMIKTHSSQHLRPSFEAVVAVFSDIPDDDDGGLEATLQKLEGTYEKTPPTVAQDSVKTPALATSAHMRTPSSASEAERRLHRQRHVQEDNEASLSSPLSTHSQMKGKQVADRRLTARKAATTNITVESIIGSHDSSNSIPLLERGLSDRPVRFATPVSEKPANANKPKQPVQPSGLGVSIPRSIYARSPDNSFEMVEETDSMKEALRNQITSSRSFYFEEDERMSDLSSEISVDIINHSELDQAFSAWAAPGTAISGLELPSHPLGHSPAQSFILHRLGTPTVHNPTAFQQMPLTPDPSPIQDQMRQNNEKAAVTFAPENNLPVHESVRVSSSPGHIPFILACDSVTLAQQFTLVEQAALTEVDWNDLVEMRWDNQSANIHDWVEYICKGDSKGVDLVITRFNLVVKWTLSEIVMTQDINERARVLAKFIHVAAHCRRLHNYATMLQITIALTSIDCSRLIKTWELVAPPDRSLLKNMEALIQPVRNFHELRDEMESADLTEGCIPFIGLYVHDLTYNAQKPAQIASQTRGEPMINFARYRTAATIIKGLLRLMDASAKYDFLPMEGVLERCLWLATLSDGKIREMSRGLEV